MEENKVFEGAKIAAIALAGVIGLIIVYKVYKGISATFGAIGDGANALGSDFGLNQSKDAILNSNNTLKGSTLSVNKNSLSFSSDSYDRMATQLYTAMEGIGTNDVSVKAILNAQKNQSDWNQTIQAFGIKKDKNLIDWLRSIYDTSTSRFVDKLKKVGTLGISKPMTNYDLNKVLMSHGIKNNLI